MLLDVDMPVMDGPTALAAMKADADLADIPVLFLTARTSGTDVAAGLQLGASDYLRKPIDPAELAARVGVALRQSAQEKTLRGMAREADRLSTMDALTGLGNRRQLELATDELRATLGGAAPVGLIIADIDHFKQVNDTEGHLVGDAVLRIVAARLRTTLGDQHQLVRWGGEEFVALAAGLDDAAVADLAERLRAAICGSPFAIDRGPHPVDHRQHRLRHRTPRRARRASCRPPTRPSTRPSAAAATESPPARPEQVARPR